MGGGVGGSTPREESAFGPPTHALNAFSIVRAAPYRPVASHRIEQMNCSQMRTERGEVTLEERG
ncbi:hypothetical protein ABZ208_05195 [Streptomyces sp. NPDC006208]|uniref:hypothetical protein n=1 Tax=Streptomyces sp. NPDC006208 TaxID=3156734 RepID=UPI0033BA10D0